LLREIGAAAPVLALAREAAGMSEIMAALDADLRARLARAIAERAREAALATLAGGIEVEVAIFDRSGNLLARTGIE
jgi:cobalamin biosynthesis protein CbiD